MERGTQCQLDEKHTDDRSTQTNITIAIKPVSDKKVMVDKKSSSGSTNASPGFVVISNPVKNNTRGTQTPKKKAPKMISRASSIKEEKEANINKEAVSMFFKVENKHSIEPLKKRSNRLIGRHSMQRHLYKKTKITKKDEETLDDKYLEDFIKFLDSPEMVLKKNSYLTYMYKAYKKSRKSTFDKLEKEEADKKKRVKRMKRSKSMKVMRKKQLDAQKTDEKTDEPSTKRSTIRTYRNTGTPGKYKKSLHALKEMGYAEKKCKQALFKSNGDLQRALQIMVK